MYLIIRNKYLKKIKNFVSIFCDFSRRKQEGTSIRCTEDLLTIYLASEAFNIRLSLPSGDNLTIKKPGEAIVNLKFLNQLFESLEKNNDLEIFKAEENLLQFFSGKFTCNLRLFEEGSVEEEEFEVDEGEKISLDYSILKNFFVRLKDFCKSPESNISTNTVLTNIHLSNNPRKKQMEAWSSDSYRVVYGRMDFSNPTPFSMNISPQIMNVILGLFSDYSSGGLDIWLKEDVLTIVRGEYSFRTKLNMRKYPDFMHWFDEEERFRFSLDKDELIWAIDRNLLLSDSNIKTTSYRVEDRKMSIEYRDQEKGFCTEVISVEYEGSEKIEFSLNSHLLKSLLKIISSTKITFSISSPLKPIVILSEDGDDPFKQFILPLSHA